MKRKEKVSDVEKLSLDTIGRKVKDARDFGQQIIIGLGDRIFQYKTKQELLFNLLKQISPVNYSLEPNDASIEEACDKIIRHFGMHRQGTIRISTDTGWKEIKPEEKTSTEKFCQHIIEMDKVPAQAYQLIYAQVNEDLIAISKLIKQYESQSCIQKYFKDNRPPELHKERVIYEFYKRCVEERIKILDYHLFGIKERALEKSRYRPGWFSGIFAFSEVFKDRPYYFSRPFSIHYFDSNKIDRAAHRLRNLPIGVEVNLQNLYADNPAIFYRRYFKLIPVERHFQNFFFYLSHLPFQHNRKPIFEELVRLFKAKRWISFYALALPQVEGLFSEMCVAISPEKDLSQKALTHKVYSVRPYHALSISYFDYYQYHIPLQRNSYLHIGYDEDFKLKSFDLLTDLSHLLEVFYELDNPLVKVKKLHARRDFHDFISLKEFVDYFQLINALKPQQKKNSQKEIDAFEKNFLCKECSIEYTCYEMMQALPKLLKEFLSTIQASFSSKGLSINFDQLTHSQLIKLLSDQTQAEIISTDFAYNSDTSETLSNYALFLFSHRKQLPSLSKEVMAELDKLEAQYGTALKNILEVRGLLEKQPNE